MTNLEQAVYLAMSAIIERYPETCELTANEREKYYRELIVKLRELLPDEGQRNKKLYEVMRATHECCGKCVD